MAGMKGGLLAAIEGAGRKPGAPADDDEDLGDLEVVMGELGDALKSGDNAGAARAFKSAHAICRNYDEE